MDLWTGSIRLEDGSQVDNINIFAEDSTSATLQLPKKATLRALATVKISELPLSLVAGPSYAVWTDDERTRDWFSKSLLREPEQSTPQVLWFETSKESYAGILVKVKDDTKASKSMRITEFLFYGVLQAKDGDQDGDAVLYVRVLPLSTSQIDSLAEDETPPASRETSPQLDNQSAAHGRFINPVAHGKAQSRKRPTTSDIFDAAEELRRKIKRRGGAGISQVAASFSHSRSNSQHNLSLDVTTTKKRIQLIQKPLSANTAETNARRSQFSRTSSFTGDGRTTNVFSEARLQRQLERTRSLPTNTDIGSLEQQNKDAISNLVLKGMRLYGLQPKKRMDKEVESPVAESPSQPATNVDDEYKQVYLQTCKATCFAFVSILNLPNCSMLIRSSERVS
jgi:hypothetical protein